MKINIGVSARHIHLCEKDYKELFGEEVLTKLVDLTQPGQYACNEKVNLITEKGRICQGKYTCFYEKTDPFTGQFLFNRLMLSLRICRHSG